MEGTYPLCLFDSTDSHTAFVATLVGFKFPKIVGSPRINNQNNVGLVFHHAQ